MSITESQDDMYIDKFLNIISKFRQFAFCDEEKILDLYYSVGGPNYSDDEAVDRMIKQYKNYFYEVLKNNR